MGPPSGSALAPGAWKGVWGPWAPVLGAVAVAREVWPMAWAPRALYMVPGVLWTESILIAKEKIKSSLRCWHCSRGPR